MFENIIKKRVVLGKELNDRNNNDMHIAFGISSNYTRPIGITITSILRQKDNVEYVFHVVVDGDIPKMEWDRFYKLCNEYNTTIIIYLFNNDIFKNLDDREFTIAAYYRFAIPKLLNGITDRFLYLDADILIVKPLSKIREYDLNDSIAGVVKEFNIVDTKKYILEYKNDFYFNSGVMYVNIPKWLNEKVSEKCLKLLREVNDNPQKKEYYGYAFQCFDQDALNIVLKDKVVFMESKYNFMSNISLKSNRDLIDVPKDAIVVHYHGFNKPWHEWCFHPLNKYYRQVTKDSPWADVPWDNKPTKYRQMRLYARYYFDKGDIINAVKWLYKSMVAKSNKR